MCCDNNKLEFQRFHEVIYVLKCCMNVRTCTLKVALFRNVYSQHQFRNVTSVYHVGYPMQLYIYMYMYIFIATLLLSIRFKALSALAVTVQLNTFTCESHEKFCKTHTSSMRSMYTCIMLCSIQHVSNSMCVVCPLVPHHHEILLMHSTQVISIKAIQITDNIHTYLIQTQQQSISSQYWHLLLVVNIYVALAQNSFYHFRMVVTCATFGLPNKAHTYYNSQSLNNNLFI